MVYVIESITGLDKCFGYVTIKKDRVHVGWDKHIRTGAFLKDNTFSARLVGEHGVIKALNILMFVSLSLSEVQRVTQTELSHAAS